MTPTTTASFVDAITLNKNQELLYSFLNSLSHPKTLLIGCNTDLIVRLNIGKFEITTASNIHEARKIIQANAENTGAFDAIICDHSIGEKSIFHFAGYMAVTKSVRHLPFILFTDNKTINQELYAQTNGIDDLITSETAVPDLIDKISILKKYKYFQTRLPYSVNHQEQKSTISNQAILKRMVDIIVSSLILLIVSPLLIIIAIAIKLESKGPVFYKSLRAGAGYKVFTFFKFRTMVVNADEMVKDLKHLNEYKDFKGSYFFKIKDDPRVTRVGHFLRKTSLDELPQLINVLKGDMSLVGNRPLPLYEACSITVDKSAKRFLAPAGITGLWQVTGRSNDKLTVDERISMDINYAENHSFLFDMKILLKTPKELILKNNV